MKDHEMQFAISTLDDHRALIAAGKAQRWDITKWVAMFNIGLAAAKHLTPAKDNGTLILWLVIAIGILGLALVWFNNVRMTGARNQAVKLLIFINDRTKELVESTQGPKAMDRRSYFYDWKELIISAGVIILSVLPALYVVCYKQ